MEDLSVREMQDMQRALQERYRDIWPPVCPDRERTSCFG